MYRRSAFNSLSAGLTEGSPTARSSRPQRLRSTSHHVSGTTAGEHLAAGRREGLAILEGWRFEEFGRDALDLVEGRLAFAIRGGKLVMTRTELETTT